MIKKSASEEKKHIPKPFRVIAIGASEGGLEAISEIVKNITHKLGMAIVYVQHVNTSRKSLSKILSTLTKMKVQNARPLLPIEPDTIYIIPPDQQLSIIDRALSLDNRMKKSSIKMPVDAFFNSVAEVYRELSIGIV